MRLLHPVLVSAIVLAGCGAATAQWEKSGATLFQIDEDLQRCQKEPGGAPDAELVRKCMLAKGYSPMR